MAVVLQTLGERATDTKELEEALAIFRESLAVFEREKDDLNWAAAQNNIGNVLLALGQREKRPEAARGSRRGFPRALEKRDRAKVPLDWAATQNNIGIALFNLSEREAGTERLAEAEAAYRLALEEYTRDRTPVEWAMVQNNLGNTLNALASAKNDVALFKQAADTFRAAMEVRTRERLPLQWAATQLNLASTLNNIAKFETGHGEPRRGGERPERCAHRLHARPDAVRLGVGQEQSRLGAAAARPAQQRRRQAGGVGRRVPRRRCRNTREARVPLDYAMANYNLGNSLQLAGQFKNDPGAAEAGDRSLSPGAQGIPPRGVAQAMGAGAGLSRLDAAVAGELRETRRDAGRNRSPRGAPHWKC